MLNFSENITYLLSLPLLFIWVISNMSLCSCLLFKADCDGVV